MKEVRVYDYECMHACENVVLTLDLFMYHQGKMVSLQDAGQLP